MMKIKDKKIVEAIARSTGVRRVMVEIVMEELLKQIEASILRREDISFGELGKFTTQERKGYNIKRRNTKGKVKDIKVYDRVSPMFTFKPKFRRMINDAIEVPNKEKDDESIW